MTTFNVDLRYEATRGAINVSPPVELLWEAGMKSPVNRDQTPIAVGGCGVYVDQSDQLQIVSPRDDVPRPSIDVDVEDDLGAVGHSWVLVPTGISSYSLYDVKSGVTHTFSGLGPSPVGWWESEDGERLLTKQSEFCLVSGEHLRNVTSKGVVSRGLFFGERTEAGTTRQGCFDLRRREWVLEADLVVGWVLGGPYLCLKTGQPGAVRTELRTLDSPNDTIRDLPPLRNLWASNGRLLVTLPGGVHDLSTGVVRELDINPNHVGSYLLLSKHDELWYLDRRDPKNSKIVCVPLGEDREAWKFPIRSFGRRENSNFLESEGKLFVLGEKRVQCYGRRGS